MKGDFKLETNELNEWLKVQQEKEEDNLALVKYTKEDDFKSRELGLAIDKLVAKVTAGKATLIAEVTQTQVAQIELESAASSFQQLHNERQDLIKEWDLALTMMKTRDGDIDKSHAKYRDFRSKLGAFKEMLKNKQGEFDSMKIANQATGKKISLLERHVLRKR